MKEADHFLQQYIEGNHTPSIQYFIFNEAGMMHRFISGFADIQAQRRVDEDCTYHAYSVTKTFTALAVLQLAEKKQLEIEAPVKEYLNDFPYSPAITIRQLLSHSAGIPNPLPLNWIHLPQEHATFNRADFFNRVFEKHNQVKFQPNEKFAYSNLGYVLLGQLIEKVSGMHYEQYVKEHILMKLGLHTNEIDFQLNISNQVKGYQKRAGFSNFILNFLIDKSKFMGAAEGKWKPFQPFYVNGVSYGGLICTPNALVQYLLELLKQDSQLISAHYKEMLFKENFSNNHQATGMCLSWFAGYLKGEKYFAHAGGGGGYYCEIRIYPHKRMGSVIMFNRTGISDERFLDKVDQYFI